MATEPIRRVREQSHETALDLDIRAMLRHLAALPPSIDAPYVTVALDWQPDGGDPGRAATPEIRPSERRSTRPEPGPSRRPSRQLMERELEVLLADHGPRGAAFDSLSADAERIATYLDEELDPSAQGVFIVACDALGVFEPLALGLPVPTRVAVGPAPALSALAWLDDDHPTYAVLLADQHEATLSLITQATLDQSVALDSSEYPRKQQQGGWSQRRFQARADERVAAFARGIAEETRQALDEAEVGMLIVAGDEVITSALDPAFHQTVTDRIVGVLRLDIGATQEEIVAAAMPLVAQAERDRETEAVAALEDGLGGDGAAAVGPDDTLTALQAGQAATLVLVDDFSGQGWADYALPLHGVGDVPAEHPAGGDPSQIVPVALEDELIRLAISTGAEVQIVHSTSPIRAVDLDEIPDACHRNIDGPATAAGWHRP